MVLCISTQETTDLELKLLEEMTFTEFKRIYVKVIEAVKSPGVFDKCLKDLHIAAFTVFDAYVNGEFGTAGFDAKYRDFNKYYRRAVGTGLIKEVEVNSPTLMNLYETFSNPL